jgi:phosphoribosyl 1,2-cyclic phosphodiesterase
VVLETPGAEPIVLDLGTGLRFWGETQPLDGSFAAHALVTHLHFDHVQGLPFLAPADRPGAQFDIYAPPQEGQTLGDAFHDFIRPPYFPIRWEDLRGTYQFHEVADTDLVIGDAKVMVRSVPHVGLTNGYRVDVGGATVAYVSDHQMPADGTLEVPASVLELADGVDLLIHDAQYTPEEFAERSHWGHCTVEFAVHLARTAKARRLALFHHDPMHGDEVIDRMLQRAQACAGDDLEVVAAAEGLTVTLADPLPDPFASAG